MSQAYLIHEKDKRDAAREGLKRKKEEVNKQKEEISSILTDIEERQRAMDEQASGGARRRSPGRPAVVKTTQDALRSPSPIDTKTEDALFSES